MPRTALVQASEEALRDVCRVFEGTAMTRASQPFFDALYEAGEDIRYPLFLRSGHTAGKYNWRHTCYVEKEKEFQDHIIALIEYSDVISLGRFSCEWWAVRELLPLQPVVSAPLFADMPVCREFRAFVVDGAVRCLHPYWSAHTLEQGGVMDAEAVCVELARLNDECYIRSLAASAGKAMDGGAWSVDILQTRRGWTIVDMAEAKKSHHKSGCTNRFD